MLSLARNGYAAADVDAALHASRVQMAFQYNLHDRLGVFKKILTTVESAQVAYSADAAIKRTLRLSMTEDPSVDFLSDQIRPWCLLTMPGGGPQVQFPLGVFLLSTPPRQETAAGVSRQIEGYDLLQVLADDKLSARYSVALGASYTSTIASILTGAGIAAAAQNITSSALTVPAAREWEPGTPKLTIVNDLLSAINYDGLFFDATGTAVARPYVSAQNRGVDYTYADDSRSVILPGVQQSLDLFGIPNTFVAVVSQPDRPPLTSTYVNSNPSSPTSTASRGRTITSVVTNQDAADQATLDARVARMAFEASQVYDTVSLSTGIMPFHGHRDVLQLNYSRLGITAVYEEVGWSFDLSVNGQMKHTLRRVVNV
jgi:hypothetical protein